MVYYVKFITVRFYLLNCCLWTAMLKFDILKILKTDSIHSYVRLYY